MIDTAKIDEKIKKLQELKQIASDPEMVKLFMEMVGNTSGHAVRQSARKRTSSKKGAVLAATAKAINAVNDLFFADDVMKIIKSSGFIFAAEDPKIAVNGALRRLVKRGQIRVAKRGIGRAPSLYEKIKRDNGNSIMPT